MIDFDVELERLDRGMEGYACGVGRVAHIADRAQSIAEGQRVLVWVPEGTRGGVRVDGRCCVLVPDQLPSERAVVVPRLALALWVWDIAGLELGETAVFSSGSGNDWLNARVAGWRSGRSAIRLDLGDDEADVPDTVNNIDAVDPQAAIEALARMSKGSPGFVALICSRKSEALDVLLEAMPTWGRLVLGVAVTEPATIDFYSNVHRKGVRVLCAPPSPACMFEPAIRELTSAHLSRALRIMQNGLLAIECV